MENKKRRHMKEDFNGIAYKYVPWSNLHFRFYSLNIL